MSLVNIKTYPVSHNKGNGGGGVTYINNSRKANIPDNLYVKSVNASLGYIDYLRSKSFSANDANITDLISERANITNLYGENISFNNGQIDTLNSNIINTKQLTAEDIAALRGIINDLKSDNITTETLTVTGQAHFFELIIDKIKAIGGQLLISAASCEIDYVRAFDANDNEIMPENFVSDYDQIEYFIVYWESKNSEGDEISNDWIANDQAICQSFNKAKTGISRDISNKYYWRLVNSVSNSPLYINYTTGQTTDNQTIASKNTYNISFLETQGIGTGSTTPLNNNISWHITPLDLVSGTWTGTDNVKEPSGVFDTTSAANGLVLTPIAMQQMPITDVLRLTVNHSSNKVIDNAYDVIVMFEDGTANVFADNSTSNSTVTFNLQNVNTPITSITIMTKAPIDWHLCHYMRLSNVTATSNKNTHFDSDGEIEAVIPEIGDNIVQLGYRGTDALNAYRQSAIIISAYKTPDADITPPSYAQYIGINDFNLKSHRQSYFDANGARFLGDITLANIGNETITDKMMKLVYASAPIISVMNEDGSRTTTNTFNITINTVDNREYIVNPTTGEIEQNPDFGKTIVLDTIPAGYSIFTELYDKNGLLNYNVPVINSGVRGGSLSNLSVYNSVDIGGITYYVMAMKLILVKGNNKLVNILDNLEITYDEKDYWNTDSYFIISNKEVAYANIVSSFDTSGGTDTPNTQKVVLFVDLNYSAGHYKDGELIKETLGNEYTLRAKAYYQPTTGTLTEFQSSNIVFTYNNKIGSFTADNYLSVLWPQANQYWDYMDNYKNNRDKNPVMIEVELVHNNTVLNTRTVYVSLQSGAVLKVTNNAIVSSVNESKSYTNRVANGLQQSINNNTSLIQQTATDIMTNVQSNYATKGALGTAVENLESSIDQSAGMIRTEVKRSYGTSDTTLDDNNSNKYFADLTPAAFNESKYYKVTITPNDATSYNDKHVFISQIERNLESDDTTWGKPSYGKQTSPFGFNLMLNMSFITGSTGLWTNGNLYINEYYLQYSDAIVCGDTGIEQANRCFTIWLRGGSRYMIRTSSQSSIVVLTTEKSNVDEPVTYTPTMSSIEQTAERISLSVFEENGVTEEELNRTGIDIENGKIILDAQNTIFNGNVVMNNPDDGLIIQDEYGNAKINIQNNEIGTLDNFDFGINNVIRCTNNNTYGAVTSITETFDTVNLGSLKSGQKLFVTNMGLDAYINNVPDARVTAVSYSYTIKCGSTTIVTNSGNATYSSLYTLSWRVPDYINNNLSSTGSYTLVMTATFIISGRGQFVSHFGGNIYGQNTNIIRLAIDGGVLATSDTIYNWFGSDKTQLRNGAQAIRLLNGKIQRNSYNTGTPSTFMNNWSDISSTIPYRIINTTNYTATVDDGLIYFATDLSQPTMRTLTLPAASTCPGKIFFVKNGTSGNVFRIVSQQTTGDFMWHSDNTIQNQIDDAGRESYFFISCRLFWISFNCD